MVAHAGLAPPALTIGPLGRLDPVLGVLAVALLNFAAGAVLFRYADPDRSREVVRDARAEPAEAVLNGVVGAGLLFVVAFSFAAFPFGNVLTVALTILLVGLILVGTPLGTAATGAGLPLAMLRAPDVLWGWIVALWRRIVALWGRIKALWGRIERFLSDGDDEEADEDGNENGDHEAGTGEGSENAGGPRDATEPGDAGGPDEPAGQAARDGGRVSDESTTWPHHRLMTRIEAHDPWFGLAVGSLLLGLVGLVPVVGGFAMFLVASPGVGALLRRTGYLVSA